MRRAIAALSLALALGWAAPQRVTLYLAGDSTMAQKLPEKRPETGWGEALVAHFDSNQVRIVNRAKNGRSTRTFIEEGLWQAIVDSLHAGDWVFIQFGHNDESKEKTDRYTPPDGYRRNLQRFVDDVRAHGGTPVLFTPVMRRKFDKWGTLQDTHGEYPGIVREVASLNDVALVDMHRSTADYLARCGAEPSRALFLQLPPGVNSNYPKGIEDNTHFSPVGAAAMAQLAVSGLRQAHVGLASLLRAALPADSAQSASAVCAVAK